MKHIKLLTPIVLATSSLSIALPLASCANTSTSHISIALAGKNKSIDVGEHAYYIFNLDKDSYTEKDFDINLEGDHSSDLSIKPIVSNKFLLLKVGCAEPYDANVTYSFTVKFNTNSWKEDVGGLTLKINGAAESELVNTVNEYVSEIGPQKTFSDLNSQLIEKFDFDLETEPTGKDNTQWVWDKQANVIFVMDSNDRLAIAPKSYTKINENKANLWKMVKAKSETNRSLKSFTNESTLIDEFDSTTQFSQYLRSDSDFSGKLEFCSGLDTGSHQKLELVYNKQETASEDPVVINTTKSSLVVNGSLSDIEHYGNLTELTVDSLGSNSAYSEFGSVDAAIVVKSGSIVLEEGSSVNSVIVDATSASDVNIEVESGSDVGTIGATSEAVAQQLETVVSGEGKEEVGNIETEEVTPTPDPSEEAEFYSGNGTENFPYTIKTKKHLDNFAAKVASRELGTEKLYFNLVADIDYENGNWTPVGTQDKPFRGIFNGCGFSIKNIKYVPVSGGTKYDNHIGFFANTKGTKNDAYGVTQEEIAQGITCQDKVWNKETNELIEENITEDKYDTVIKYLNIENVNAVDSNKYFVGGIAGIAENTYFYQCNVKSGTIHGQKHVGGLVGTCGGCIFKECSAGSDTLQIIADVYHVGGLAGSTGYDNTAYLDLPWSCFAFVNCSTGSKCTVSTNAAESGGSIGGLAGDNQVARCCIYVGCTNSANINVTSKDTSSYPSHVGGIAGFGQNVGVIANCVNNGDITITNGSYCGSVGGMSADPNPNIFYKDINNGNITGYVVNGMAGITAIVGDGLPTFTDCENNGTLNNTGPGTVGDIYC